MNFVKWDELGLKHGVCPPKRANIPVKKMMDGERQAVLFYARYTHSNKELLKVENNKVLDGNMLIGHWRLVVHPKE
jgi:hypothetical protein